MAHDNVFGDFEDSWKEITPAERSKNLGRVPNGNYKVMLTVLDQGTGVAIDHDLIDNSKKGGSKGIKIFLEIISPTKVGDEVVKGRIIEHVFWITDASLPYVKRDVKTIFGRDIPNVNDLLKVQWAGNTAEVGIKNEEYNGYVNSRVNFWNEWRPNGAAAQKPAATKPPPITVTEPAGGDDAEVPF